MVVRAPIDPAALVGARELSDLTVDELARAAGVPPERIEEFESAEAVPTSRQLTLGGSNLIQIFIADEVKCCNTHTDKAPLCAHRHSPRGVLGVLASAERSASPALDGRCTRVPALPATGREPESLTSEII